MLAALLLCTACTSFSNNHNTNITISETEHRYSIIARYPEAETGKVEDYLTDKLGKPSHISFANTHINADLTLDDGTIIYMKNNPGSLTIQVDKDKNSNDSYQQMKAVGSGLKNLLQ